MSEPTFDADVVYESANPKQYFNWEWKELLETLSRYKPESIQSVAIRKAGSEQARIDARAKS